MDHAGLACLPARRECPTAGEMANEIVGVAWMPR